MPKSLPKLFLSIGLCLLAGGVGAIFTTQAIPTWYASLNKPFFSPPNWIFAPVWTTLYILMGISLFMIWQLKAGVERNRALGIFAIQMALNFLWSFLFFYFHNMGLALSDIVALWISIVVMLYLFYKLKPVAAYINIPYILWVSFATALNAAYLGLN